jgi:conjugative transfer signal peptidase TraF
VKRAGLPLLSLALALVAAAGAAPLWGSCTFNHTASMPRGLYLLRPGVHPGRGALVTFPVPAAVRPLVAERRYLPASATLLKRVVAVEGDVVCLDGEAYMVNRVAIGRVLSRDRRGQPLEAFRFCGKVGAGQAFVAADDPASFDSRYFGPIALDALTVARPLWTF